MTTCLSPVNLTAPMSAFFLKPTGQDAVYLPFPRDIFASFSVITRQPRGPPEQNAKATRKPAPAPVNVPEPPAPVTSWRDRVSAGPAEMPKAQKTSRAPPTPKSGGKRRGRRSDTQSPAPVHSRSASVTHPDSPVSAPIVNSEPAVEVPLTPLSALVESKRPSAHVYDITFLLCLAASPLNGVSESVRAHMEDIVYNHTWRRGPHQFASRSSSRASSPAPSSRASSPASSDRVQRIRRESQPRRASSKLRRATSDHGSD
ncbi:hypothetical protein K488DRAFT_68112 [Vararia minispora EC-137]|uniref:Uncharacterized protein n=1 Tax=Vararia minispora EC-137 TaxID=1314806 RepID=A0ACB8QVA0_9AGAM|nr:hypothetical protein K488DRAFT_68112 [Vararia minispora EC-137]